MNSAWLLWHIEDRDEETEDSKLVGAYSSQEEANAAIARLKDKPGFAEQPDGWFMEEYRLNEDHWTGGYRFVGDDDT
jgi:hypothetical protein